MQPSSSWAPGLTQLVQLARRDGSPPFCADPHTACLDLNTFSKQSELAMKGAFSQGYK